VTPLYVMKQTFSDAFMNLNTQLIDGMIIEHLFMNTAQPLVTHYSGRLTGRVTKLQLPLIISSSEGKEVKNKND